MGDVVQLPDTLKGSPCRRMVTISDLSATVVPIWRAAARQTLPISPEAHILTALIQALEIRTRHGGSRTPIRWQVMTILRQRREQHEASDAEVDQRIATAISILQKGERGRI